MSDKFAQPRFGLGQKVVIVKECDHKGWIMPIVNITRDDNGRLYELLTFDLSNPRRLRSEYYRDEDIENLDKYVNMQTDPQKQRWEALSPWERQIRRWLYQKWSDGYRDSILSDLLKGAYGSSVAIRPDFKEGDHVIILTGELAGHEAIVDSVYDSVCIIKGMDYDFEELELITPNNKSI